MTTAACDTMDPLEAAVLAACQGKDGHAMALTDPVWLAWRKGGRQVAAGWYETAELAHAVSLAWRRISGDEKPDALEICLTRDWESVSGADPGAAFPNSGRGVSGMEIRFGTKVTRIAPTRSIATNRAPLREIERMAKLQGMTPEAFVKKAQLRRFAADQFLYFPHDGRVVRLWRGGQVVPAADAGPEMLEQTVAGLCDWMRRNVHADGRLTYKYWPSRGMESQADNTIRQFMGTVALGRIAARTGLAADAERARATLTCNLARFYREEDVGLAGGRKVGRLGMIIHEGKAKLGAFAMAALAILEFRNAGLISVLEHEELFQGLYAGIMYLRQEDGAFRTFLHPPERNDNQNFYPGEAMLFLAALHRKTRDPDLAARCMQSFRTCRDWHFTDPNPAFVPWHSQACVMLYEDLGDSELADFVLDRNDWVLEMQQWSDRLAPDFQGRFYNPARQDFGPPHASATGVYMEGLADAWRLAKHLGEARRTDAYAIALRRGLRAIRQLQFRDREIDGYYISRPGMVMGGLRTEVYNNEIRVDNVQHCLMALLKLGPESGFDWTGGV